VRRKRSRAISRPASDYLLHRDGTSSDAALEYVARVKSPLLIVDADAQDSVAVCDAARAISTPPSLLVTLTNPEAAERGVDRCDSV